MRSQNEFAGTIDHACGRNHLQMTQFVVCGLTWHRRGLHSAAQYLPRKNAKTTQNAGLASYGTCMFHAATGASIAQICRLKLLNARQVCRTSAFICSSGTKSKTANSMPDPTLVQNSTSASAFLDRIYMISHDRNEHARQPSCTIMSILSTNLLAFAPCGLPLLPRRPRAPRRERQSPDRLKLRAIS